MIVVFSKLFKLHNYISTLLGYYHININKNNKLRIYILKAIY